MNVPKCLVLVLIIALCSLPAQCKVKKIKAVTKLIKAKMLLKPLLKTGIFKMPMVHFVIPIQKPNMGNLGNLFGNQQQQHQQDTSGNNRQMKCRPMSQSSSPNLLQSLRIPGLGCKPNGGGGGGGGGMIGSSVFPMLNFGTFSRLNFAGLFGGSSNDCSPPTTQPNNKDCRQQRPNDAPMRPPPPTMEAANWRPIYSPMAPPPPTMVDLSMADFGNLNMDEYMNMVSGVSQQHRPPPPPSVAQLQQTSHERGGMRLVQWNADQDGHSAMHHSPQQGHHHQEQQQIEQTRFDEEEEEEEGDNSSQEQKSSAQGNAEPVRQAHVTY